jgi:DNA-binding LytR/AlgR family response regulator
VLFRVVQFQILENEQSEVILILNPNILSIISMKTYEQRGDDSLLIINQKTSKKISINNVVLLKGDVNYTVFHFLHGKEKMVARSIKFFEKFLETHGFLRIHRSFMVNPNYIEMYNAEKEILTMRNGQEANISRRRKHTLGSLVA